MIAKTKCHRRPVIICAMLTFIIVTSTYAQIGGTSSYQFLHSPVSSRANALGGVNVSLNDMDVALLFANPALVGDTLNGVASLSYQAFVGDISHTAAVYSDSYGGIGTITLGIQHMGYGTMDGFDDAGNATGSFSASETAIVVSKSHEVGNYRIGGSLKGVFSNLASYRSAALAVDIGAIFIHPENRFSVGMAIRNLGLVLTDYSETANSSLPFDVQVGTTFKPEHMPVRFSLTAFNLASTNVSYDDPADGEDNVSAVRQVLAHVNFGAELLFHRNVNALIGYNFLNHQELRLPEGGGGAGLSLGLAIRIKAFEFVLSRAGYVAGQATYAFTLSGNMNKILKRA